MTPIESLRQWVLKELPYDRADEELVTYLKGRTTHDLLVTYLNWIHRFIPVCPRKVQLSKLFLSNSLVQNHTHDFRIIFDDILKGRNLNKYLSRDTKIAVNQNHKKSKRRRDLDLMLNSWNVHHLHISTHTETDGYVSRSKELLFAVFTLQAAYFIDVFKHESNIWYADRILKTIADEWPDKNLLYEIKGVTGERTLTEAESKQLRNVHANTFFTHNGKTYMPTGSLTGAGTTITATRDADYLIRQIEAFEGRLLEESIDQLKSDFQKSGLTLPDKPDFEFNIVDGQPGFIEQHTRGWIKLFP